MIKKIFKDLLNKEIKVGDTVLNVWANDSYSPHVRGHGDTGVIQYRIAKVIKFTAKGIRIEFTKHKRLTDCSIYNTHNRIIIMTEDDEINIASDTLALSLSALEKTIFEKNIKTLENNLKSLEKSFKKAGEEICKAVKTIQEQDIIINDLKRPYQERFGLLDL